MTTAGATAAKAGDARDRPLGRYRDRSGRTRRIVARPAARGTVLVIDEDAQSGGDRRLVAHLAADEPAANAALAAALYLADPAGRFARPVAAADWQRTPDQRPPVMRPLIDARRRRLYRIAARPAACGGSELRWTEAEHDRPVTRTVALRDVVGTLEAYDPACALTVQALADPPDPVVSTATLADELERLRRSPVVLNRPLRDAVQRAMAGGLSLSQIAARCGHAKSRRTGLRVGDTSWLGRRVGLLPEAGGQEPSPWIHSDVLALIARDGLGLDPRQVEQA